MVKTLGKLGAIMGILFICHGGRDSVVGIATRYELDDPGIDFGGGEIFRAVEIGLEDHPAYCTMSTCSLSRG